MENNLGVLFVDLLRTYGRIINTQKVGITCQNGGSYFSKKERTDWINQERPYLFAVEDPADPENDIGRNSFNIILVLSVTTGCVFWNFVGQMGS
jgi:non-canonical poly(A) RNA polymerase PAPD5/7